MSLTKNCTCICN